MNEMRPDTGYRELLQKAYVSVKDLRERLERAESSSREPIAIVGIGCRFPGGAASPQGFWDMLKAGRDAIDTIPRERWDRTAVEAQAARSDEAIPQFAGLLTDIDRFAAGFFGIAPVEAAQMDPQQRLLLEVAWEALENAAIAPQSLVGSNTGVFAGISTNDYSRIALEAGGLGAVDAYFATGNSPSVAAGRLSYLFGLEGPCLSLDTACSSSLVAVHLACESMRRGECDMALAMGVNLILRPELSVAFAKANMLAPDGRCKTFDASADGYVRGEGCGVVVLRPLSRAIADGDRIWAVIRGSAVNQDGRSGGLTAPNGPSQEALIRRALKVSGIDGRDVTYVEAHGTGTPLGDPIELQALGAALDRNETEQDRLYVGSVKTNMGHLEAAAGIAGLIKAALAVHHGEIPSHLHFRNPNPNAPWNRLSIEVPRQNLSWPEDRSRIAGVSSFGFSGTNAHVILEAPPARESESSPGEGLHLLVLSAKTETALRQLASDYAEYLKSARSLFSDVCFTAAVGRNHWKHRIAIAARSAPDAAAQLTAYCADPQASVGRTITNEAIASCAERYCAGQTIDWRHVHAAGGVRVSLPTYPFEREPYWVKVRQAPEPQCGGDTGDSAESAPGSNWRDWTYQVEWKPAPLPAPPPDLEQLSADAQNQFITQSAAENLDRYRDLMPALERLSAAYVFSALDELGVDWKVGEVIYPSTVAHRKALDAKGARILDRLMQLLARNEYCVASEAGLRLTRRISDGPSEIAVEVGRRFPDDVTELKLLQRCGPRLADIVRGACDPLQVLAPGGDTRLLQGVYESTRPARIFNAAIAAAVAKCVQSRGSAGNIRILEVGAGTGGTTSAILKGLVEFDGEYVFTDLSPAFFGAARDRFASCPFMEYRTLDLEADLRPQGYAAQSFDIMVAANVVHATRSVPESLSRLNQLLVPGGLLLLLEITQSFGWVDLTFGLTDGWWRFDDDIRREQPLLTGGEWQSALGRAGFGQSAVVPKPEYGREPAQAVILARSESHDARRWLVLADAAGIGDALAGRIRARGERVTIARDLEDEQQLASAVADATHIVNLWGCDAPDSDAADVASLAAFERRSCESALRLVQFAEQVRAEKPQVWIVTRGAQASGGAVSNPAGAVLWGLGRVWAAEAPECFAGLVDLAAAEDPDANAENLFAHVMSSDHGANREVAWRNGVRFRPVLSRCDRAPPTDFAASPDGGYLITGGTGGIGRKIARWLVERGARHVFIAARHAPSADVVADLQAIETSGATVEVIPTDISNPGEVRGLLERIAATGRPLRGIVHAAGVFDDRLLAGHDWTRFEAVLAPKVYGAWNLHSLTKDLGLDVFLCMSSAAAFLAPPGFGNYAAANAFLDALASYRSGLGLAATSIGWGPWTGVGMADKIGDKQAVQWERAGVRTIAAEAALDACGGLIQGAAAHTGVIDADWASYTRRLGGISTPPLLKELERQHRVSRAGTRSSPALRERMQALPVAARRAAVQEAVRSVVGRIMGHDDNMSIDPDIPFGDYGLDSLMAVSIAREVSSVCGIEFSNTLLFDHSTLSALTDHIASQLLPEQAAPISGIARATAPSTAREPIAIVGMGCRFPGGANSPELFWNLLRDGVDAVREIPDDRWSAADWFDPDPAAPGKVNTRWGGFIDSVDTFDSQFFGIAPREAEAMDPQHRLMLEVAWEALEDAAIAPDRLKGSPTGVFMGIYNNDYGQLVAEPGSINAHVVTGNSPSIAAGRLSYLLGLQGPSMAVDTACSSSLVTVHLACQSLRSGETSMAIAGGVNLMLSPISMLMISQLRMMAPDGRCKTFDAAADGFVRGEGCGIVVLKRLSDAVSDGDRVLAVIRGSAVNQDGRSTGITAPNGPAQESVLRKALADAAIDPAQVDFVEAHGTGTALGDPIEVQALHSVFSDGRSGRAPLLIGSVKTNFGHLEAAAGIAGLIKTVLALTHHTIPPHLHLRTPNPAIAWDRMCVEVSGNARAWPRGAKPRTAGVSSFGFSGTNAHIILEQAPNSGQDEPRTALPTNVLTLSAKSESALRALAARWLLYSSAEDFSDICFSANVGRASHPWRLAVVASSLDQAKERIGAFLSGEPGAVSAFNADPAAPVSAAFVFPADMADAIDTDLDPYRSFAVVRETLDECAAIVRRLFPTDPSKRNGASRGDPVPDTVPCVIHQIALARLWRSLNIEPKALIGHGVGEIAAACFAELISVEDAIALAAGRSAAVTASGGREARYPAISVSTGHPVDVSVSGAARSGAADFDSVARDFRCDVTVSCGQAYASPNPPVEETSHHEAARLWCRGLPLDWSAWDARSRRKVEIPSYPFQRNRYWLPQAKPALKPVAARQPQVLRNPLLGRRIRSILRDTQYEAELAPHSPAFLNHHRVHGLVVLPATAMIEMALAAGASHFGANALRLQNVSFLQALVLPEDSTRTVQCVLSPADGFVRFQIASFTDPETAPVFHANGEIHVSGEAESPIIDLDQVRAQIGGPTIGADVFYSAAAKSGFDFGETFRGIKDYCRSDGRSLARILAPDALKEDSPQFQAHPALLDACFQAFATTLPVDLTPTPYIPVRIDSLTVHQALTPMLFSHVRLDEQASHGPELFVTDLDIVDERGQAAISVRGFTTQRASLAALRRNRKEQDDKWLYRTEWRAVESVEEKDPAAAARRWFVVGSNDGKLAERVADALGARAVYFDWRSSVRSAEAVLKETACDGVVFVCEDETDAGPVFHAGTETIRRHCAQLLDLARLAHRAGSVRSLCVVTRGAQAVSDAQAINLDQAPVLGLTAGLMLEHPEFDCGSIDLDPEEATGTDLKRLPDLLDSVEERLAVRGDRTLAARLRRVPVADKPAVLKREATYLITGGHGALGLEVARWMASRGAGHIVLVGRNAPDADASSACREIEALGAKVHCRRADMSDVCEVERLLVECGATLPPLTGIVHAAGVLADAPVFDLQWSDFEKVMAGKVVGARTLDILTSEIQLDFFVMFSSAAALWGSFGQANYAAANAYLGALAHDRRRRGLPGLAIDWGPWAEIGMAARGGSATRLERFGVKAMPSENALRAFETLLAGDLAQAAVVSVDWERFAERGPWRIVPHLFDELAGQADALPASGSEEHRQVAELLGRTPAGQREAVVIDLVQRKAARVLGLPADQAPDVRRPLSELGLDSFMAVELARELEMIAGRKLPATVSFEYPTIAALGGYLMSELLGTTEARPASQAALAVQAPISSEEELLREVAGMKDDQVRNVLREFLAEA